MSWPDTMQSDPYRRDPYAEDPYLEEPEDSYRQDLYPEYAEEDPEYRQTQKTRTSADAWMDQRSTHFPRFKRRSIALFLLSHYGRPIFFFRGVLDFDFPARPLGFCLRAAAVLCDSAVPACGSSGTRSSGCPVAAR